MKQLRDMSPISGLSKLTRVSGTAIALSDSVWVEVLEVTGTQKTLYLAGIKLAISGGTATSPVYRISAKRQSDDGYNVVAPYDPGGQDLTSGKTDTFVHPIQIPKGSSYRIEVYAPTVTAGTTAQVVNLNVVEFLP